MCSISTSDLCNMSATCMQRTCSMHATCMQPASWQTHRNMCVLTCVQPPMHAHRPAHRSMRVDDAKVRSRAHCSQRTDTLWSECFFFQTTIAKHADVECRGAWVGLKAVVMASRQRPAVAVVLDSNRRHCRRHWHGLWQ